MSVLSSQAIRSAESSVSVLSQQRTDDAVPPNWST